MKIISGLLGLLLTASAFAGDVIGQFTLTILPTYGTGTYAVDVRQEKDQNGTKLIGTTSFGHNTTVSLDIGPNTYHGLAGGDGFTDLRCTDGRCSGLIGGSSAYLDVLKNRIVRRQSDPAL